MTRSITPAVLAVAMLAAATPSRSGASPPTPAPTPVPTVSSRDVLAMIGAEPFTERDLEEAAGARLFRLRTQYYQARRQLLDDEIGRRLLDREAAARKVTVEELLKHEVEAKVAPVTSAERKAFYDVNKAGMGNLTAADALKSIEAGLHQQRVRERQEEFVNSLRAKVGVRVLLEPPRLAVEASDKRPAHVLVSRRYPSRGGVDAPVTIVEFSDFQCPYCSEATDTLKKLEAAYPGKIRLVYRDFPLVQIHPRAARAAEAAACANDQARFWAMHDALFAHQDKLEDKDLKQTAADLGLNAPKFDACLDSGRHGPEWRKDAADGEWYGVSKTPAFFVNGRLIVGAQPYERLARIVEEELARSGGAAPNKASTSR